jgi:hypothetical protein
MLKSNELEKDMKGGGRDLTSGTNPAFSWRDKVLSPCHGLNSGYPEYDAGVPTTRP